MTFEEFFKKKKIDLDALQRGEPGLFAEFKKHFEQMGEKSFDHTKKYWFNKLRQSYHTPAEVKVEKVKIENPLAEQTITDGLTKPAAEPTVGFKPRFNAAMASKPVVTPAEPKDESTREATNQAAVTPPAETPKVGFKPRFKASMVAKSTDDAPASEPTPAEPPPPPVGGDSPSTPAEAPKVGFKPRFKASMVNKTEAPQAEMPAQVPEEKKEDTPAPTVDEASPKTAYKPKFNMKNIKPRQEE